MQHINQSEKSNNVQNRCAPSKMPSSENFVPDTNILGKTLAQEISDQLLYEHNSHKNNQSTTISSVQ